MIRHNLPQQQNLKHQTTCLVITVKMMRLFQELQHMCSMIYRSLRKTIPQCLSTCPATGDRCSQETLVTSDMLLSSILQKHLGRKEALRYLHLLSTAPLTGCFFFGVARNYSFYIKGHSHIAMMDCWKKYLAYLALFLRKGWVNILSCIILCRYIIIYCILQIYIYISQMLHVWNIELH